MARYLEILSIQSPFPIGVDANDRILYSVNFRATVAAPTARFEEEIARILIDANLILGTTADTYYGPGAITATGPGPFVSFTDTGGMSPLENHDGGKYERRSIQIVVRGKHRGTTLAKANAIWRELDGKRNIEVAA